METDGKEEAPATPPKGEASNGLGPEAGNARTAHSPWTIQLRRPGEERGRSAVGETPVLGIRFPCAGRRAASATRPLVPSTPAAGPRAAQDGAMLGAMRRQLEALEEKVGGQMSELRRQAERPREAAFTRLEDKIGSMESSGARFDLRLSELVGSVRGLSEEMQAQIRRVDVIDERLSEWRRQMEEDVRLKHNEFEQSIQRVASNFRVSTSCLEDGQKRHQARLGKFEGDLSEMAGEGKRLQEGLAAAEVRLEALEERQLEEEMSAEARRAAASPRAAEGPDAALYSLLDMRLRDVAERADRAAQDSFEIHASLSAQEEQLRSLRTLSDASQEHWKALGEQVERGDWTGKLERLREAAQEEAKQRVQHEEELKLLHRKVEFQEQGNEELRTLCEQLASDASITMAVEECRTRIEEAEARIGSLGGDLEAARTAAQLTPKVGALVASLQELVPRVTEQEAAIRELRAGHHCSGARTGGLG